MTYQVNLLDASLRRRQEALGSLVLLVAVLAVLALAAATTLGVRYLGLRAAANAAGMERTLSTLQTRAGSPRSAGAAARQTAELEAELARLRAAEADTLRVRAALDSGRTGSATGYADHLLALSRQTHPGVWLTRFEVAQDGQSIELVGRMTNAALLPDYLRRLKNEPLFAGHTYAQLNLRAVDSDAGAREVEFALRSTPSASSPGSMP
jgi:MSHA biogenesis protein MshI